MPGAWSSKFAPIPGADLPVKAMASDGANLYVGGAFSQIGGALARGVAMFDGHAWSELGEFKSWNGFPVVAALFVHETNLYVGGTFYEVGGIAATNIAKWNGHSWEALGPGLIGNFSGTAPGVFALHHDGTNLYAGGAFDKAGSVAATNIARWDGQQWHSLGDGLSVPRAADDVYQHRGRISSITRIGTNLFVGGQFIRSGTNEIMHLARWDGTRWNSMATFSDGYNQFTFEGRTIYGSVETLAARDRTLMVGGDFTRFQRTDSRPELLPAFFYVGQAYVNPFTRAIYPPRVYTIRVDGADLMIGGEFADQQYGATNLFVMGFEVYGPRAPMIGHGVYTSCRVGDRVFIGGDFVSPDGSLANIGELKDGRLRPIATNGGLGLSLGASNLATDGTNVFVSGYFEWAGTNRVSGAAIVKWDGTNWSGIDSVPGGTLYPHVLAAIGTNLFVAGTFTVEYTGATNLGVWGGTRWLPVGSPENRPRSIGAMIAVGSRLYVAEEWGACKWLEGTNWFTVPWNTAPGAQRLGTDGRELLIARRFDDHTVKVARWTGRNVLEIPGQLPPSTEVTALAALGTNIFVATRDTTPYVNPVLFRWNGSVWSEYKFTDNFNYITSMAPLNGRLLIAGNFGTVGGTIVNSIALWDNDTWHSLDAGITAKGYQAWVNAVTVIGNRVYAAGRFSKAGSLPSSNFAIWHSASDVQLGADAANLQITGGLGDRIQIESSSDLTTWNRLIDLNISNPTEQIPHTTSSNRFYRAKILEP
ncbi:MAG TPA: hypothetical protein VM680_19795 [Verrucomicrobiae bacterium]|nr:hypothetical protein [Verrucomicrobiae bacterium]